MTKLIKGVNDLETYCKQNGREDLLAEWHPTRNKGLTPSDVSWGSAKKVWWLHPYDDKETGKHFEFEWESTIANRVSHDNGCPYLSGRTVWKGFNDLETYCKENGIEDLLREWHPTKNYPLTVDNIIRGSSKKVWWQLSYDDTTTGKHFDFEWQATIASRVAGSGCPYLSVPAKEIYVGFNDLATAHPELAKEWHPIKNGSLTPLDVTAGSNKKVWWLLPYDDTKTGKHFDFEWKATILARVQGAGCPYLSGKAVWKGFNDFETYCKQNGLEHLLEEWHSSKNGVLKPSDIVAKSNKKVWWLLPYDDKETGKHFDFEWETTVANRVDKGAGNPFLSGRVAWKGFNDLETYCKENGREDLLEQWHPKNLLTPSDYTSHSPQKVFWLLHYTDEETGKHFEFEWKAKIESRVYGDDCPYLSGHQVWKGFNDLETYCKENGMGYLLEQWHPTKNSISPAEVTKGSSTKVWWQLKYYDTVLHKYVTYEWQATIVNRAAGNNCPYLSSSKAERLLSSHFSAIKLPYNAEYKFFDTPHIQYYPYDFYLPLHHLIIEMDGLQHFQYNNHFYSTEKDFEKRVKTDNLKNKYCLEQNIPILRIPYTYDADADKDKIIQMVTDFISTRVVPKEILDFYEQFKHSIGSNYYDIVIELNKYALNSGAK